jgi:hypothetical protein
MLTLKPSLILRLTFSSIQDYTCPCQIVVICVAYALLAEITAQQARCPLQVKCARHVQQLNQIGVASE